MIKDLISKYAELFEPPEIRSDPAQSCIAFGIETGEGWYTILDETMSKIMSLPHEDFYFTQIKEKFGTLRVYHSYASKEIDKIVFDAEILSETTCEVCGKPGSITGESWYKVRCEEHKEK